MSSGSRLTPGSQALDFALGLGAHAVLPKPFSLDDFRALIGRVLAGHASAVAV